MVLDAALINTLYYKVRIKDRVEQSRERSSTFPYTDVVSIEKRAFRSPLTNVANFTYFIAITPRSFLGSHI